MFTHLFELSHIIHILNNFLILTKQTTLNTQAWTIFQPQIIYVLLFEETHHILLGVYHLSSSGRNIEQKPLNSLQLKVQKRVKTPLKRLDPQITT